MKKLLPFTVLTLFLFASPALATWVSFDFKFNFYEKEDVHYLLKCIDTTTGELLLSKAVKPGQTYDMQVSKADHERIICLVLAADGPTVAKWRFFPQRYYQGCGDSVDSSLPTDPGTCGDGVVSGAESCDTGGNVGCGPSSANPRCCHCDYCGCADDADCPQVTGAQCGYSTCTPTERPHFWTSCYDCGVCIYGYHCVTDPTCTGPAPAQATAPVTFDIGTEATLGGLAPGQSGVYFLQEKAVQVTYTGLDLLVNGELIPGPLEPEGAYLLSDRTWVGIMESPPGWLYFYLMDPDVLDARADEWLNEDGFIEKTGQGNAGCIGSFVEQVLDHVIRLRPLELVNLTIAGDRKWKVRARHGVVTRTSQGVHSFPTLKVRTDLETLESILEETLTVDEALAQKKITFRR